MNNNLLRSGPVINDLLNRLSALPAVMRYGDEEPGTLTHAFVDLEESFRKFLDMYFPRLVDPVVSGAELDTLLTEIEEEFRHILYHLHDPQSFRLLEPTHDWLTVTDSQ